VDVGLIGAGSARRELAESRLSSRHASMTCSAQRGGSPPHYDPVAQGQCRRERWVRTVTTECPDRPDHISFHVETELVVVLSKPFNCFLEQLVSVHAWMDSSTSLLLVVTIRRGTTEMEKIVLSSAHETA
jgi:hypothetical protein